MSPIFVVPQANFCLILLFLLLNHQSILIYNYTLFSPTKVLKILYPENWQTMQLRKHFTNSYFFGLTKHVQNTKKEKGREKKEGKGGRKKKKKRKEKKGDNVQVNSTILYLYFLLKDLVGR